MNTENVKRAIEVLKIAQENGSKMFMGIWGSVSKDGIFHGCFVGHLANSPLIPEIDFYHNMPFYNGIGKNFGPVYVQETDDEEDYLCTNEDVLEVFLGVSRTQAKMLSGLGDFSFDGEDDDEYIWDTFYNKYCHLITFDDVINKLEELLYTSS